MALPWKTKRFNALLCLNTHNHKGITVSRQTLCWFSLSRYADTSCHSTEEHLHRWSSSDCHTRVPSPGENYRTEGKTSVPPYMLLNNGYLHPSPDPSQNAPEDLVSRVVYSLKYTTVVYNVFRSFHELVVDGGGCKVVACYQQYSVEWHDHGPICSFFSELETDLRARQQSEIPAESGFSSFRIPWSLERSGIVLSALPNCQLHHVFSQSIVSNVFHANHSCGVSIPGEEDIG